MGNSQLNLFGYEEKKEIPEEIPELEISELNKDDTEPRNQLTLFDKDEFYEYKEHWKDMPEFICEDLSPFKSIIVHFMTVEDMREFSRLINQKIHYKTISIYYPKEEWDIVKDLRWVSNKK